MPGARRRQTPRRAHRCASDNYGSDTNRRLSGAPLPRTGRPRRGSRLRMSRQYHSSAAPPRGALTACQGVDLRTAGWRGLGRPGLAGVAARPYFAAVGGARHQVRTVLVEGDLEHRVRHRRPDIDPGPAVPAVAAVQKRAGVALEPGPGGDPEM